MKKTTILFVLSLLTNFVIAQNTILWSVKKPNLENTSYILGTFHQMGNSFVDEKPLIKELISKSELVIFESIENKQEKIIDVMLKRADDYSYRELLYKEDVDFLENYTKEWSVPLSKQKPGEFIIKFLQEITKKYCGTIKISDTSDHMDSYLQSYAEKQNLRIYGLETYADQKNAFSADQENAINTNKEELTWDKAKDIIHQHIQNEKNQNIDCKLAKDYMKMKLDYQFKVKCAENGAMLTKRNEKWMPQIIKSIEENNSVFIAVGLYHLYEDCGIISQLRKNGYEVKPIKLK